MNDFFRNLFLLTSIINTPPPCFRVWNNCCFSKLFQECNIFFYLCAAGLIYRSTFSTDLINSKATLVLLLVIYFVKTENNLKTVFKYLLLVGRIVIYLSVILVFFFFSFYFYINRLIAKCSSFVACIFYLDNCVLRNFLFL